MAKIQFKSGDEYLMKLSRLGARSGAIAKMAVYEGVGIVADAVRASLHNTVSEEATGDLERSIGISEIKFDEKGDCSAKIGYSGYDSKGAPNVLKARTLEKGKRGQNPKPYTKRAVNASRKRALEAMRRIIDEETAKIMK